jgi:two-component sensor histidine kinase/ligand-binding sensor domain-containing protein
MMTKFCICSFHLSFWVALSLNAQEIKKIPFQHISVTDGLSVSNVNCFLHDSKGFMWFGTANGLNKYDGYNFTVYKNDRENNSSLPSNLVNDIIEDEHGDLWIATYQGLSIYNRKKETFLNYLHADNDSQSIVNNIIQCLLYDKKGNFWIGTEGGLSKFENNHFVNYVHSDNVPGSLANNDVTSLMEDSAGILWIGTRGNGIDRFDATNNEFIHHMISTGGIGKNLSNEVLDLYEDRDNGFWIATQVALYTFDPTKGTFQRQNLDGQVSGNAVVVTRLSEDRDGNIWIGTENDGLYLYNKQVKRFRNFRNSFDPASLSNNSIWSIYKDRNQNMWVGTYSGPINLYDVNRKQFSHYNNKPWDGNSISQNSVLFLTEDKHHNVWIGTDGGGLDYLESSADKFYHFKADPKFPGRISGNHVGPLLIDQDDNLWTAAWGTGISILPAGKKAFTYYRNVENDSSSLSSNYCFEIDQDREGHIWVATLGAGLNRFNADKRTFTHYNPDINNPDAINSKWLLTLFEDSDSNLWIGTEDLGLNMLKKNSNKFLHYVNEPGNLKSLSNNTINVITEDKRKNLWIGTNGGLNKLNYKTKDFKAYLEADGLPSGGVKSIQIDDHGNLWLGTSNGISKFDPSKGIFKNYNVGDGLQGNEFNRNSAIKTASGEMYFGGTNGFNRFFPDSIKDNTVVPPIVITDFLVFNKSLEIGEGSPLTNHINETKEISLDYSASVFSIEFAALDFIYPQKIKYAYKLEEFDQSWNYIGNKRTATYTHLDPGEYTFRVIASNSDGIWNKEGKSLKIIIVPPFWATLWFKFLCASVGIGSIFIFVRVRLYTLEKQKAVLENKVAEKSLSLQGLVKQQEKLLNEKEWLIKEIHHRVKNNFHMVTGLLSTQASYLKNEEAVRAIAESQQRITAMALIHQRLYQSNNLSAINMPDYIRELVEYLKDCFDMKTKIHFDLQIEAFYLDLSYSLPIGLIINEAVTNSMKYAFAGKEEGTITILLNRTDMDHALLSVIDNGVGFSPDLAFAQPTSMGMNLMRGLSEDIKGTFSISANNGTHLSIAFKRT